MANRHITPSLATELEHEWIHITSRPELVGIARSWRLTADPAGRLDPFETLDDVLATIGYHDRGAAADTPAIDPQMANAALGRLVRRARTDQLAGRVILQRILPGLHAAARRWRYGCRHAGIEPGTVFDELVAVAWAVIASYDVDRRPRNIASRLVWTTVDRTLVGPSRRQSASEQPHDLDVIASAVSHHDPSPSDELTELLTAATLHRDADAEAIALLCDLVRADGSTATVAARHGVSARTIRNRRTEAAAHVRRLTQPFSC